MIFGVQLGSAYFVFPGGSHHRFEHSIGKSKRFVWLRIVCLFYKFLI